METYSIQRKQLVEASLGDVFAFFSDAANLEALTPPWLRFRIATPTPIQMQAGTTIEYRIEWRIVPIRWRTEIVEWSPPHRFVDVQLQGPYKLWHHTHTFTAVDGGTLIGDAVRYALPLGRLGQLAHWLAVRRDVERVFDYRAERVAALFGERAKPPGVEGRAESLALQSWDRSSAARNS